MGAAWTASTTHRVRHGPTNAMPLAGFFSSLGGSAPQSFEVVVGALAGQENVGQHRVEIEQDPGGVVVAVHRQRPELFVLGDVDHRVRNCSDLAVGLAFANYEVVGDGCLVAYVHDHRIPRLLVDRRGAQHSSDL